MFSKNLTCKVAYIGYIFNVLPTGEYLMKFKVIDKIPKCLQCGKGAFTVQHIFYECEDFHDAREYLQQNIKELGIRGGGVAVSEKEQCWLSMYKYR